MSKIKRNKIQKLLKIREAAEMLSVNPETLRRWDRTGKLKAIIISPPTGEAMVSLTESISKRGDRRYRKEDIEKLIRFERF